MSQLPTVQDYEALVREMAAMRLKLALANGKVERYETALKAWKDTYGACNHNHHEVGDGCPGCAAEGNLLGLLIPWLQLDRTGASTPTADESVRGQSSDGAAVSAPVSVLNS